MMQTIRFSGLNVATDEQAAENGALAVCDGMELHAGALRPCVIEGETVASIHGEILYIHELSNGRKNAIYALGQEDVEAGQSVGDLYYLDITNAQDQPHKLTSSDATMRRDIINAATSNGNTLVMLTTEGMRYFKWDEKGADSDYRYLGGMPPELEINWKLDLERVEVTHDHLMYDFYKDIYEDHATDEYKNSVWNYKKLIQYNENTHKEVDGISYERKCTLIARRCIYSVDSSVDYTKSDSLLAREEANEAAIGKFHQLCKKRNYFSLPFLVRYCYRLWDGRKIMHSAPVLMFGDVSYPEAVLVAQGRDYAPGAENDDMKLHIPMLYPQKLFMDISEGNQTVLSTLKEDWKDIVTGIDVYVTPGISRRDENVSVDIPEGGTYPWEGKWKRVFHPSMQGDYSDETSVMLIKNLLSKGVQSDKFSFCYGDSPDYYRNTSLYENWPNFDGNIPDYGGDYKGIRFPSHSWRNDEVKQKSFGIFIPQPMGDDAWSKKLAEQNAYYLLHRFDLRKEDIQSGLVPIDEGVLESIEAQEQMITSTAPDDYRSHNKIIASASYVYNNRINLTGIKEIPFEGFPIKCLIPYVGDTNIRYDTRSHYRSDVIVRLEDENGSMYVRKQSLNFNFSAWLLNTTFIFYPDTRAREMWVIDQGSYPRVEVAHFDLEEHPFLNGAYHMGNFAALPTDSSQWSGEPSIDLSVITMNPKYDQPSYIFTSASGNPFVFPAAHRYRVGMGEVKGIASTTRALSQGQFGQFPMIAFATDGIYALDVSSTGSYSGIQPISREVITNAKALLQLDQSIAFITRRAVNQLISSDVNELSAALSGALRDLSAILGIQETREVHDLIGAVQNAEAVYDFANSRLLYFLKGKVYDEEQQGWKEVFTGDVLVFCANDTAWAFKSLGENKIRGIYNSYPYPYIHHKDGTLECLSAPYDNKEEGTYNGIVVTRAIKAEGVRNAIRGFFQDYDFGTDTPRPTLMLWGSNDNRTWHYVGKSNARQMGRLPGKIYRYFRLAVQFKGMRRNDLYHGVQLDIQERFTR